MAKSNRAAGLLLCHALGEAMKANGAHRGLLAYITRELSADTHGFAETRPKAHQQHIRDELNKPHSVTLGQPLKVFIRDHIRAGYKVNSYGLESPDGLHAITLPALGLEFAGYLVRNGF